MAAGKGGAGAPPTKPKTGGSGDSEAMGHGAQMALDDPSGRSRKAFVVGEDFEFTPASLVGSWFHRLENDRVVWQGVVVAEPQPAAYLVQIDQLDVGALNVQRLIPLERMIADEDGYDWRFFDTEHEAQAAYANWVATERERV